VSTSIFIVDDHPMVVEGIQSMLRNEPSFEVCGVALNGKSCLAYFINQTADVVLLDINLPDVNGMDICRELMRKENPPVVIALTNFDQLTYMRTMKEAGARGYLMKNSTLEQIRQAIDAVSRGEEYWLGKKSLDEKLKEIPDFLLTRREIEVLRLISEGLTNHQIADKLFVSESTIDTHRKNLLSKFDVKNTAALVRLSIEKKII